MTYAKGTNVSKDRSIAEIQRTLARYKAAGFTYGEMGSRAFVGFQMVDRVVKMLLTLPEQNGKEFTQKKRGYGAYPESTSLRLWDQACREKWRALALVVKAKLESVESGIETFDEAFLPHIVVPGAGGRTYGELALPDFARTLETGELPKLLPM